MAEAQAQAADVVAPPSDTKVFDRIALIDAHRTEVEERDYEKEMKKRWSDLNTAHMRALKVGRRVKHERDDPDDIHEVFARIDAGGRVRLFSKPYGAPFKALEIRLFPEVLFDEPTTPDYETLRPRLLYLRMQIANLERTERVGAISRMEGDLISRSARCRGVGLAICDAFRYVVQAKTEPYPGWNHNTDAMSRALHLVDRLGEKFKLPTTYYFRTTAAIAARHLLLAWNTLPTWFTMSPRHVDDYIMKYDEFVTIKMGTTRRRNTLNYAAIFSGHPTGFNEAVFMKKYDPTLELVVKSVEDLHALTAASVISGPVFEESLAALITEP